MNLLKTIFLAVLTFLSVSAFPQNDSKKNMEKKNVLVVYFSAMGTTKRVAEKLANLADADICEIIPINPYTMPTLIGIIVSHEAPLR